MRMRTKYIYLGRQCAVCSVQCPVLSIYGECTAHVPVSATPLTGSGSNGSSNSGSSVGIGSSRSAATRMRRFAGQLQLEHSVGIYNVNIL